MRPRSFPTSWRRGTTRSEQRRTSALYLTTRTGDSKALINRPQQDNFKANDCDPGRESNCWRSTRRPRSCENGSRDNLLSAALDPGLPHLHLDLHTSAALVSTSSYRHPRLSTAALDPGFCSRMEPVWSECRNIVPRPRVTK